MHLFAVIFIQWLITSTPVLSFNGTSNSNSSLMFIYDDDLQCLTQMPLTDLLKIRRTIASMHIVSEFDEKQMSKSIDNHGDDKPSELRELPDDAVEPRTIFRFFKRKTTTETPSAASLTANAYEMWQPNRGLQ